ncbi:Putative binding domain-containing protein, N-terminal [Reichenbachiella agariperforans]|uniref:Putative binding domain-containing protein, N-terminal n=1 Tax=Reichenbachiella agariperforans TaxID=156994 RepID=A0A1M6N6H4_REIAG|nr:cellulase family glycosylhydrolase [Reichenbachiella agariperforans]SHJ91307.1 Putative binding domain-containing protein, N-terminal [Reichenbachiella agariperforans]
MKGYLLSLLVMLTMTACNQEESHTLSVTPTEVEFPLEGGSRNIQIETNAGEWQLEYHADWLTLSSDGGIGNKAKITLTVEGKTLEPKTEDLIVTAGDADPVHVSISQLISDYLHALSANTTSIDLGDFANSQNIEISSEAEAWTLQSDADWLNITPSSGGIGTTTVTVVASSELSEARSTTLLLSAEGAPTSQITVSQTQGYPDYNTNPLAPDASGMGSTAMQLYDKMTIGWNIGNTLEAIGSETAWGNPQVTEELIQLVKQNGFNAIRIPCAWDQYIENQATAKISEDWLNRVKEVVQYCVDNDMYTVLNIHWDGGWLENNITPEYQIANNAKQKALWEQIATHLRDFDEHLIFAGTNEPNVEDAEQMAILDSYHQTFVDAVRATGGKNSHRVLIVQGPSTDVEKTHNLMSTLPTDEIADKMMVEVHYYTPFQYCLMGEDASWGKMFYYWGANFHSTTDVDRNATWGEEADVDRLMALMKTQFFDKGIPMIMGEYAVVQRLSLTGDNLDLHLASRAHYLEYVTRQAKANGMIPFYWDAGNKGDLSSALFDRATNTVYDQRALDAIVAGSNP